MLGTPSKSEASVARAIASAWPRSSASTPGNAPAVSTSETTGKTETVGKLHEAHGLAIAFRPRHAEIMLNSCFGAGAFFLPKNADRTAAKPAETADDRGVLAKLPVARQGREIAHESLDIIAKMRPLRMPRDLRLLPGRQIGIKIGKRLLGLGFEPGQFLARWQRRRPSPRAGGVPEPWLRVRQLVFQNRDSFALPPERLCQGPDPPWRRPQISVVAPQGTEIREPKPTPNALIWPLVFRSAETRYFEPRSQEAAPAVRMVWRQTRVKPRERRFRRSTPRKAR